MSPPPGFDSLCHNWPFLLLKTKNTILNGKFYPEKLQRFGDRQRHLGIERCKDWGGEL
jgi:hypothetical protein